MQVLGMMASQRQQEDFLRFSGLSPEDFARARRASGGSSNGAGCFNLSGGDATNLTAVNVSGTASNGLSGPGQGRDLYGSNMLQNSRLSRPSFSASSAIPDLSNQTVLRALLAGIDPQDGQNPTVVGALHNSPGHPSEVYQRLALAAGMYGGMLTREVALNEMLAESRSQLQQQQQSHAANASRVALARNLLLRQHLRLQHLQQSQSSESLAASGSMMGSPGLPLSVFSSVGQATGMSSDRQRMLNRDLSTGSSLTSSTAGQDLSGGSSSGSSLAFAAGAPGLFAAANMSLGPSTGSFLPSSADQLRQLLFPVRHPAVNSVKSAASIDGTASTNGSSQLGVGSLAVNTPTAAILQQHGHEQQQVSPSKKRSSCEHEGSTEAELTVSMNTPPPDESGESKETEEVDVDDASSAITPVTVAASGQKVSSLPSLPRQNGDKKSAPVAPPPQKKKRAVASNILFANQENHCPHFDEREHAPLGIEEDCNWLSAFQCFARAEMMEVFQATQSDVIVRSTSKSVKLHQVGVRCRFCAHLPHGARVNRSSAFPSRLSKLYQSFNMMVRDHFTNCAEIPKPILEKYLALKAQNSQGACDSRHYWFFSAQKLGLVDTGGKDGGGGIFMNEKTKEAGKNKPPYGMSEEEAASRADKRQSDENEVEVSLVRSEDRDKTSPLMYELMSHIQLVRLLPSERVGKRKTLPVGLEGFGCRYCYTIGRLGFSRCYPLRRRGLSAQVTDMHHHLQRCTLCPDDVKRKLSSLLQEQEENKEENSIAAKSNGSAADDTEYLDLMWSRLGRTIDLTT